MQNYAYIKMKMMPEPRQRIGISIILLLLIINCGNSLAYERILPTAVHKIYIANLSHTKQLILEAANEVNATYPEKATVLAIASIETAAMSIDYPPGDGKDGDAYNVTIYKLNKYLIRAINPSIDPTLLHYDTKAATKLVIQGLRDMGHDRFLSLHRGGEGLLHGKVPSSSVRPYVIAIKSLAFDYMIKEDSLDPSGASDYRYTIPVKAI